MAISLTESMEQLGKHARAAAVVLANSSTEAKNVALHAMAKAVRERADFILAENAKDIGSAQETGIKDALLDRLKLDEKRVEAMARGIEQIAALPDPVGKTLDERERPNGLKIARVSVPLGVIGIIYESRPNVTADAGALCLKSGNAAILRGGSDSFHSSRAIMQCLQTGLKEANLPEHALQLVPTQSREAVGELLRMDRYIDIIVPRGGRGLIERVLKESRIPVIQHLDGNCHTYIHEKADIAMADEVVLNAKMRRTGVCGATESLIVDRAIAQKALPKLIGTLSAKGCEIRGDKAAQDLDERVKPAGEKDWDTEYLDAIISVKVVPDIDEAIPFINLHGSHHTDAIITADDAAASRFLKEIDSAIVMHNASTQFADGGEFGMGAEIGISTGRLHARGPVGVEQLTTYKYVVRGNGQIRPV